MAEHIGDYLFGGVDQLPIVTYKNKKYYVDFRLEELRDVKTAKSLPFRELKEDKYSPFKKKLRVIRFETYPQVYIKGVDD